MLNAVLDAALIGLLIGFAGLLWDRIREAGSRGRWDQDGPDTSGER